MPANDYWACKIIQAWDPDFRPRWVVFDSFVQSLQNGKKICLEIGSGSSGVLEPASKFKLKIHADIILPFPSVIPSIPFIQLDLYDLPFKNSCIDLILLRFVVEHLADPDTAFQEIKRILKPAGMVLILTTNLDSPLILLSKLLPYSWRKKLMQWLFKAKGEDIFPTYHRFNRKKTVKKLYPNFTIITWEYLQDANWQHKWWFLICFLWHLLTKWLHGEFLRSNFIVLLKKS
jgi:SAM-dependent methyltransferase